MPKPRRAKRPARQTLILDGRVQRGVTQWAANAPDADQPGWSGYVEFVGGAWVYFTARTRTRRGAGFGLRDSFTGVVVTAHGAGKG